jgi:hypothetical protein
MRPGGKTLRLLVALREVPDPDDQLDWDRQRGPSRRFVGGFLVRSGLLVGLAP